MEEVVPSPLPGRVIRVGLGGVFVGVFDFSLESFLVLGSFALAAELSSHSTCLVTATTPELSWSDLCPIVAEKDSDKRRKEGENFGST